jgi:hypothetical protein
MIELTRCVLLASFFATCASSIAGSQTLSTHGWNGSADFDGGTFLGCHLDSSVSLSDPPDIIRILAITPFYVSMQFASQRDELQTPNAEKAVRLALVNGERASGDDWTRSENYLLKGMARGVTPQLLIGADDEILTHLKAAKYLKIYYDENIIPRFATIDLRHRGASPNSTPNDTAEAIEAVLDCVKSHPFRPQLPELSSLPASGLAIDQANLAAMQAKTGLTLALEAMLVGGMPNHTKLFRQELFDASSFYCDAKQYVPYNNAQDYRANVENAIQSAAVKLGRLAFWSEQRTATHVLLGDMAMRAADGHLCPGWPGHTRPRT